ncbi:MAG: HIT family protein [Phycisphaerales bacterium]
MSTPPPGNPVDPALGPKLLQAPWRMDYLDGLKADASKPMPRPESAGCFLGDYWRSPDLDATNHVIVRSALGMVLLNAFPYANGHLLVALGEGKPRLLDYSDTERAHLWRLTDLAMDLVEHALSPQGVNVGVNQGRAAGAGVPGHLHVHLVPRWGGDVNFITTVARVRVIPSSLQAMAERYRAAWATIGPGWRELVGPSCPS